MSKIRYGTGHLCPWCGLVVYAVVELRKYKHASRIVYKQSKERIECSRCGWRK